jgi:hypothetical protein
MPLADSVSKLDGQLRLANTAEAHKGHARSGLGTSLADPVEDVSAVDEIEIAGKGDGREGGRR